MSKSNLIGIYTMVNNSLFGTTEETIHRYIDTSSLHDRSLLYIPVDI